MKQLTLILALALFTWTPAQAVDTVGWHPVAITTANTSKDAASGAVAQVFVSTENATYVDRLVFRAAGTNVATVGRVFLNNGGPSTDANNNVLFSEITLDATTNSEVAAQADEVLQLDVSLPKDYRILVTIGTAVSAGWRVTAVTKTPTYVVE